MTTGLNECIGGGYAVGPSYDLPEDPSSYHSDDRNIIGCNSLVCGGCAAKVRSILGFVAEPPPMVDWSKVYDTQDWSTLGWLRTSSRARTYVCRCLQLTELHAEPSDQLEETKGIRWRCAGHPPSPRVPHRDGSTFASGAG